MNNKPCPFCGSHNIDVAETSNYRWAAGRCCECGAVGPEIRVRDIRPAADPEFSDRDRMAAITEWNRRAEGNGGEG